jgi:sugar/nucleoside kinase (ribokinase family)
MKTIVTFGEIMGRFCPDEFQRFRQSMPGRQNLTFSGAEANVAASLAMLGGSARFVTALPKNEIAEACITTLRGLDIDVSEIKLVILVDWDYTLLSVVQTSGQVVSFTTGITLRFPLLPVMSTIGTRSLKTQVGFTLRV